MPALTREQLMYKVRARFRDPGGRYLTDDEFLGISSGTVPAVGNGWIMDGIKAIMQECPFEKKVLKILGSAYVAALGTSPRFYELPSDFYMLDPDNGVHTNGLRRIGTSNDELESYQQKALTNTDLDDTTTTTTTITPSDYFTAQTATGLIFHYGCDFVVSKVTDELGAVKYQITGSARGYLLWFEASPADSDIIDITYFGVPSELADANATTNIPPVFDTVLVDQVSIEAALKCEKNGLATWTDIQYHETKAAAGRKQLKKYLSRSTPDSDRRIQNARTRYGLHMTGRRHGGGGRSEY